MIAAPKCSTIPSGPIRALLDYPDNARSRWSRDLECARLGWAVNSEMASQPGSNDRGAAAEGRVQIICCPAVVAIGRSPASEIRRRLAVRRFPTPAALQLAVHRPGRRARGTRLLRRFERRRPRRGIDRQRPRDRHLRFRRAELSDQAVPGDRVPHEPLPGLGNALRKLITEDSRRPGTAGPAIMGRP